MTVTNETLKDLADALSGWLDRPVLDRTGRRAFRRIFGVPELAAAMRKQLGLRLEPNKGPVDVVAIDRIERPTDN